MTMSHVFANAICSTFLELVQLSRKKIIHRIQLILYAPMNLFVFTIWSSSGIVHLLSFFSFSKLFSVSSSYETKNGTIDTNCNTNSDNKMSVATSKAPFTLSTAKSNSSRNQLQFRSRAMKPMMGLSLA